MSILLANLIEAVGAVPWNLDAPLSIRGRIHQLAQHDTRRTADPWAAAGQA